MISARFIRFVCVTSLDEFGGQTGLFGTIAELNLLDREGVPLDRADWVLLPSTFETAGGDGSAGLAIDGDPDTCWHTRFNPSIVPPPHRMIVDIGYTAEVSALVYLPRQDADPNGVFCQFRVDVSNDNSSWVTVAHGDFDDTDVWPEGVSAEHTVLLADYVAPVLPISSVANFSNENQIKYAPFLGPPDWTEDFWVGGWFRFEDFENFTTLFQIWDPSTPTISLAANANEDSPGSITVYLYGFPSAFEYHVLKTNYFRGWIWVAITHQGGTSEYKVSWRVPGESTLNTATLDPGSELLAGNRGVTILSPKDVGSESEPSSGYARAWQYFPELPSPTQLLKYSQTLSPGSRVYALETSPPGESAYIALNSANAATENTEATDDYEIVGTIESSALAPVPDYGPYLVNITVGFNGGIDAGVAGSVSPLNIQAGDLLVAWVGAEGETTPGDFVMSKLRSNTVYFYTGTNVTTTEVPDLTGDWTFGGWFRPGSGMYGGGTQILFALGNTGGSAEGFSFGVGATDATTASAVVYTAGGATTDIQDILTGSTDTLVYVSCQHAAGSENYVWRWRLQGDLAWSSTILTVGTEITAAGGSLYIATSPDGDQAADGSTVAFFFQENLVSDHELLRISQDPVRSPEGVNYHDLPFNNGGGSAGTNRGTADDWTVTGSPNTDGNSGPRDFFNTFTFDPEDALASPDGVEAAWGYVLSADPDPCALFLLGTPDSQDKLRFVILQYRGTAVTKVSSSLAYGTSTSPNSGGLSITEGLNLYIGGFTGKVTDAESTTAEQFGGVDANITYEVKDAYSSVWSKTHISSLTSQAATATLGSSVDWVCGAITFQTALQQAVRSAATSGNYLELTSNAVPSDGDWSMGGWFKLNSGYDAGDVFYMANDTFDTYVGVYSGYGEMGIYLYATGLNVWSVTSLQENQWTYMVITHEGGTNAYTAYWRHEGDTELQSEVLYSPGGELVFDPVYNVLGSSSNYGDLTGRNFFVYDQLFSKSDLFLRSLDLEFPDDSPAIFLALDTVSARATNLGTAGNFTSFGTFLQAYDAPVGFPAPANSINSNESGQIYRAGADDLPNLGSNYSFSGWFKVYQYDDGAEGVPICGFSLPFGNAAIWFACGDGTLGDEGDLVARWTQNSHTEDFITPILTGSDTGWVYLAATHTEDEDFYNIYFRREGEDSLTALTVDSPDAPAIFDMAIGTAVVSLFQGFDGPQHPNVSARSFKTWGRTLSEEELLQESAQLDLVLDDTSLLYFLKLNSEDEAAADLSGNHYDFTVLNSIALDSAVPNASLGPLAGSSVQSSGTNNYLQSVLSGIPTPTGDWQLGCWFKILDYTDPFTQVLQFNEGDLIPVVGIDTGADDTGVCAFYAYPEDAEFFETGPDWIFASISHFSGEATYRIRGRKEGESSLTIDRTVTVFEYTGLDNIVLLGHGGEPADTRMRSFWVRQEVLSDADTLAASASLGAPSGTNLTFLALNNHMTAGNNLGTGGDWNVEGTLTTASDEPNPSILPPSIEAVAGRYRFID